MNKKNAFIVLTALFFICKTITSYAEITEVGIGPGEYPVYDDYQTTAIVNIHSDADINSKVIGSVPFNEVVSVIADGDKWVKARYLDTVGYIYKKYLVDIWSSEIKDSIYKLPESEELNKVLSKDLQQYLWNRCSGQYETYEDIKKYYVFLIATIDFESEFNQRAVSKTGDYGLGQTNKKWVWPYAKEALGLEGNVSMLLDNPKIALDCLVWEMNQCVASAGEIGETAYHKYNKGINTSGTDKTSHKMANGAWAKWKGEFY